MLRAMAMEDVPVSAGELVVTSNVDIIYAIQAIKPQSK